MNAGPFMLRLVITTPVTFSEQDQMVTYMILLTAHMHGNLGTTRRIIWF